MERNSINNTNNIYSTFINKTIRAKDENKWRNEEKAIDTRIGDLLFNSLGIIRDGKKIKGAIEEIEQLKDKCISDEMKARRALAEAMLKSAYERRESRGAHTRRDFPDTLEELVNISIRRTLSRTILTTVTTVIPVIVLLVLGSREISNFNIALLVGFIAGTYSSICLANTLWLKLEKRRIAKPKSDDDEIKELQVKGINC